MKLPPFVKNFFDLDIVKNNWRLLASFSGGVILTVIILENPLVESIIKEAILYSKSLEPIIVSGDDWYYKTNKIDEFLEYKDFQGNVIKCSSIQGTLKITQAKNSDEFTINGKRLVCLSDTNDNKQFTNIERNVPWWAKRAIIARRSRSFIIPLRTGDKRIGFVEGTIGKLLEYEEDGKKKKGIKEFDGTMYYLNEIDQKYKVTTIKFCKSSHPCAEEISDNITRAK